MEEVKEEKIELKSITADGESPPTTKVSCHLPQEVMGPWLRKGVRPGLPKKKKGGHRGEG